jgi:hypothetical protein
MERNARAAIWLGEFPDGSYRDGPAGRFAAQGIAPVSMGEAVASVLATGIGARLIWILLGLWSLRRYRRRFPSSISIPPIGVPVHAQIFISDNVAGPITFGLRRPMILLPHQFEAMDSQSQESILYHELIHVRRKDWMFTLLEELVLAVLWYEPAIWWLISEIRLAREQVVDREATDTIGSRDTYVDMLLQAASVEKPVRLAPVNSFFGRGHLVRRVASLVRPSTFSRGAWFPLSRSFSLEPHWRPEWLSRFSRFPRQSTHSKRPPIRFRLKAAAIAYCIGRRSNIHDG